MKILANDGIAENAVKKLETEGFEVIQEKIPQDNLVNYLNENDISIILVRSATKLPQSILSKCKTLKLIGRAGVGLDNIDVAYAKKRHIKVINTPGASTRSVAELVFAHLLGALRHLHQSNREMPLEGESNFKSLKKQFLGNDLKGKTLGIWGFGKIGREVAKIGLGLGVNIKVYDPFIEGEKELPVELEFPGDQRVVVNIPLVDKEQILSTADFITLHIPAQKHPVIGKEELKMMKKTAGIINTARGGLVDEEAIGVALQKHHLSFAALDVFKGEPHPPIKLLMNPFISLSPHIGGSTAEAQDRIGLELANQILNNR